MKEIVLVTLPVDAATGKVDPDALVNSRVPGRSHPYQDEPGVIAQFQRGELQTRFEAEWNDETGDWIFGKRVLDGMIWKAAPDRKLSFLYAPCEWHLSFAYRARRSSTYGKADPGANLGIFKEFR